MHADHARMQIVRFMHPASQPARHARPVPYGQNFLPRGTHCRHIERPIAAAPPTWLTQTLTQDIEESPQQEVHTSRVLLVRGTTAIYPNDLHVLEFDHRKRNVHIGCSMMSRPSTIDPLSSILMHGLGPSSSSQICSCNCVLYLKEALRENYSPMYRR